MGCIGSSLHAGAGADAQVIIKQNHSYVCRTACLNKFLPTCIGDIIGQYIVTNIESLLSFVTDGDWLIAHSLRINYSFDKTLLSTDKFRWVDTRSVDKFGRRSEFMVSMRLKHFRNIVNLLKWNGFTPTGWFYEIRMDVHGKLSEIVFFPTYATIGTQHVCYNICVSCPTVRDQTLYVVQNTHYQAANNPYKHRDVMYPFNDRTTRSYSYTILHSICDMVGQFDPQDRSITMAIDSNRGWTVQLSTVFRGNVMQVDCYGAW